MTQASRSELQVQWNELAVQFWSGDRLGRYANLNTIELLEYGSKIVGQHPAINWIVPLTTCDRLSNLVRAQIR